MLQPTVRLKAAGWLASRHGIVWLIERLNMMRTTNMLSIQKKLVVDERGRPQEVIISWEQYQQIVEMLGLDLDDAAVAELREASRDRIAEKRDAYVALNTMP